MNSNSDLAVIGGSTCTLRTAVAAANNNVTVAGCVAGDTAGVDQIEFSSTIPDNTISLIQGQIEITSSVTIDAGSGRRGAITIDAGSTSRVFRIRDPGSDTPHDVTLRSLTLVNGYVTDDNGGAVINVGENVTIEACALNDNEADFGLAGVGGHGGAVLTSAGETTMVDSTVSGNTAERGGGGLAVGGEATLTLTNSVLTGNIATYGGGIASVFVFDNSPARVVMTGGALNDHAAAEGGAVFFRGAAELTDVTMSGNAVQIDGGAISFDAIGSEAQLTDVVLSGNTAGDDGGAIAVKNGAQLTLTRSQVDNNSAAADGGGAYSTGTLFVENSTISGNTSNRGGGVRLSATGTLDITNSEITSNEATLGGGIDTAGATELTDSVFRANTAAGSGGAMYGRAGFAVIGSTMSDNTASEGGAIFTLTNETSQLTNTTISGNTATGSGNLFPAAVYAFAPIVLTNSTIVGNTPNGITKANSLVDFWSITNTVIADSAENDCVDAIIPLDVNVANFIGDGSCAVGAVDLLAGDPVLGELGDNGGPTPTHLPLSGSPLVDAGTNSACPATDQTGMPRPVDGDADDDADCDIGSVEFVDLFPPLATLTSAPDVLLPGSTSFPLEITYTELDGAVDFASIDPADLSVTPGPLTVQDVDLAGTQGQVVATYTVLPPGGAWDAADSGDYNVAVNGGEVFDTATTGPNSVVGRSLGGFSVAIVEIDVAGNGVSIADGDASPGPADGTAFGDVGIGASLNRTFTIHNTGGGTLMLVPPLEILGTSFSITQPAESSLGPGQSTAFTIGFTPESLGQVIGQVTILSNDADENPYTFAVSGTGSDDPQAALIFADGFESP
ncbi:MAG: choice-of-anchor D domain-containing protein [Pseudomonadota bacterium]